MKRFLLTMMCVSCSWRISDELKKHGYKNFNIDMESSELRFDEDVNSQLIIKIVSNIGYRIEEIAEKEDYTDEELLLLADALRNGY